MLCVRDIRKLTGLSKSQIENLIIAGKLKAELIGNSYVIQEEDYEQWIKSRKNIVYGRPKKK